MSTTRYYPTDLTEAQWTLLLALLPARKWRVGGVAETARNSAPVRTPAARAPSGARSGEGG
jgi:hypothetical protein